MIGSQRRLHHKQHPASRRQHEPSTGLSPNVSGNKAITTATSPSITAMKNTSDRSMVTGL